MKEEEFKEGCEMTNAQFNALLEAIATIIEQAESTAEAAEKVRTLKAKE